MDNRFQPILSSILFSAVVTATGCAAEPDDADDADVEELEAEAQDVAELGGLEDLVDEPDEARSGGGGGGCGGGCCGGGCGCQNDHHGPILTLHEVTLWPPNHDYHTISPEDCISSVTECDPNWWTEITLVTSDEPENGQGDGNTWNDIVCNGDDSVDLRAERKGGAPHNGRVYEIDFDACDHKGNRTKYTCRVIVPHDGNDASAVDDDDSYSKSC